MAYQDSYDRVGCQLQGEGEDPDNFLARRVLSLAKKAACKGFVDNPVAGDEPGIDDGTR